ncbi:porin family protein [Pontixanthobacter aestiaquae]|uniref:Outer membrane beta-barrel protein n=1 Tax=Pontixanthobacter aestiaquae TaxID=1509367 RepID=A0A844Z7H9_9SPHN|nr:porin family protein [Pontixanthobacter aestiaquae]MDN3645135.1 porin family protein [Pontixanthobacter aestiaquae]MXO83865.1 outer membrane beta-barrel protein [Pontixanthobacter aestiaquae]
MRKIGLTLTAAAIAVVGATPALAQDSDDATGARVAIITGIDSVNIEDGSEEDILYGVTAGYDFDLGGAVVGIEAEYADSSVGASDTNVLIAGDRVEIGAERDLYVGVRVGASLGGGGIVYAKGGYTNARIGSEYDDGTTLVELADDLDGFRLGVGAEFPLGESAFVRGEYRYSDYGELRIGGALTGLDLSRHQGVVGVGFKF